MEIEEDKLQRIVAEVPASTKKKLRLLCAHEDVAINAMIAYLIEKEYRKKLKS